MLKRFLSILMISMCFVSLANAKWQGREPCSGKKVGLKHVLLMASLCVKWDIECFKEKMY